MQAYQMRVVVERDELFEKLHKLRTFFSSPIFAVLVIEERERLTMQYLAMAAYHDVLNERIVAFGDTHVS